MGIGTKNTDLDLGPRAKPVRKRCARCDQPLGPRRRLYCAPCNSEVAGERKLASMRRKREAGA